MKRLGLTLLLLAMLLLSACSGYNFAMVRHLGDMKNYREYECTLLAAEETEEGMYLTVSLSEEPTDDLQYDYFYSEAYQANTTTMRLIQENAIRLEASGFFDTTAPKEVITIKASPYIYMDGNFFYIIAIKAGDTVYLDEETGLKNMVEMMDDNKSWF